MAAGANAAFPGQRQVRQVQLCNVHKTKALRKMNTNDPVKAPCAPILGDSTIFYTEFLFGILLEDKISYGQSLGILSVLAVYWSVT